MKKISTVYKILLTFVLLIFTAQSAQRTNWPIKENIDLSSGFGDYRQNRIHAGIDLRTGGKEGLKIYSPVSGYIYRIKMSYDGYGKGLYIKGNDGFIYVFGHLQNFSEKIDKIVKEKQLSIKRYYIDNYFPEDSVKIEKNEHIGYTGKTGSGQPHLHFEKRTKDNFPLNPLKNGFEYDDQFKPVFEKLIVKQVDDHSLFYNGLRELQVDIVEAEKKGEYKIDQTLYLTSPFGLLAKAYDKIRTGGMNQSVYKLSLYYDDELYYEIKFDRADFDQQRMVNFIYDYPKEAEKIKNVRRLFDKKGNVFEGAKAKNNNGGIFGYNEKIGRHQAKIIAEDVSGNKAVLNFEFIWGPPDYIYHLDSSKVIDKKTRYYFTPIEEHKKIGVDSVQLYLNRNNEWGQVTDYEKVISDNGQIILTIPTDKSYALILQLIVFSDEYFIWDNLFNGIQKANKQNVWLDYKIFDDGLIVKINVVSPFASDTRLALFYKDSLLGIEYPEFFNTAEYLCFIPPSEKYERIDKIGYGMSKDSSRSLAFADTVNIFLVGHKDNQVINIGDDFTVTFNKDNFYEPRFIELKHNVVYAKHQMKLNSNHLRIIPDAFVCRKDFEIKVSLPEGKIRNQQSGICWLDREKNTWIWLENEFANDTLRTEATGGGDYAAVMDLNEPKILFLNIVNNKTYNDPYQEITFNILDTLSGIKDDQSILVRLDNEWLIPEYEPKSGQFITQPNEPLTEGKHHLGIMVTDQAGNTEEQYLNFFYKEKTNQTEKR